MHIAFVDRGNLDYVAETPYREPLGGSQSALCYLAVELAGLGHAVSIINGTTAPGEHAGVNFVNLRIGLGSDFLARADVIVELNAPVRLALPYEFPVQAPLVLWMTHATDQPIARQLSSSEERDQWAGFAFISDWQRERYIEEFSIPRAKSRVLRIAIAPPFAKLAEVEPWFVRQAPPILFYTSTPDRGLNVLLFSFPYIRSAIPGTRLRVFSSRKTYQVPPEKDKSQGLYEACRRMKGVEYIGSIGQDRLADELVGAAALSYPSTYAETACIAALEAMAVGAAVLTTRHGALPETTAGFAYMVDHHPDRAQLGRKFADMAIATLLGMLRNPAEAAARRNAQIGYVKENYGWPARAREWESWLLELTR